MDRVAFVQSCSSVLSCVLQRRVAVKRRERADTYPGRVTRKGLKEKEVGYRKTMRDGSRGVCIVDGRGRTFLVDAKS